MKVTIIGWYGTETIGDRAILAGILSFLEELSPGTEVMLGSLYPFFSERTVSEDAALWKEITGAVPRVTLFDSKDSAALEKAVLWSDMVIMGGGPLMHINAMFMVEYAFRFARRKKKKTMIFGCGVGPITKRRHVRALAGIAGNSDLTILRDRRSADTMDRLSVKCRNLHISLDPSVKCLMEFLRKEYLTGPEKPYVTVNIRDFPPGYGRHDAAGINSAVSGFVVKAAQQFPDKTVRLIPMHYFHIGGDDREVMNEVRFGSGAPNLEVQNVPLSLLQTMQVFRQADFGIGMRYHSVIFQTLLNGNNYILDYTEPGRGKTGGFLEEINAWEHYAPRYINLGDRSVFPDITEGNQAVYRPDWELIAGEMNVYAEELRKL